MIDKRIFFAALFLLGQLHAPMQAAAQDVSLRQIQLESVDPKTYRIGSGDAVSIVVFPVTEYSKETTVGPDGNIELQLLGLIPVKGLNALELQSYLEERYRRFVSNPKITVNVRRFVGRRVAILGEIKTGGYFEYREGLKILDLLSMAGGLTDIAKPSKTKIIRQGEDKPVRVNLRAVLAGDPKANITLAPGDTVFVPKGRLVQNTQWVNSNILPWATFFSLIASIVILNKQL